MYIVTQVFKNAVEIWDSEATDEWLKPVPMTVWMKNPNVSVGDVVTLCIRKVEKEESNKYPGEPIGRSGVS